MFEIAFLKAATREKADIYHAHDLNTLFHAWVATIINKSVLVYDAHELESELVTAYSKSPMIVRLKCEIIEGIFIKKARDVITVSESIAKVLTDRYHIKPPHVIKNCPRISKAEPHDRIRQIFGIDKSKKIIVYQGNFTPDKEIEKLVEIACCIDSAVLVLIGDGVTKARVEAKVIDTNMAKRVFFLGRIPNNELLSYTAGGDIGLCIFPNSCLNIYYSLPNKIFEYLMAGLPVVASDFPEIKKIVEEHNVGRTVVSTNPIEIANIINKIFDDDRLYRQMRENARRIAVSIYNWENESKKLLKLYEEL